MRTVFSSSLLKGTSGCRLRARGVQSVCRVASDAQQARDALDVLWESPKRAGEIMAELRAENEDIARAHAPPL